MTERSFNDGKVKVINAKCLDYLKTIPDNSLDSCVVDPPYGLSNFTTKDVKDALNCWLNDQPYVSNRKGFAEHSWDNFVPGPEIWKEVYRVLKPGSHMLCFASTRTLDLMSMAIRLSDFEIRDTLFWAYHSAMANSTSIGKMIDKHFGLERTEVIGVKPGHEAFAGKDTWQAPKLSSGSNTEAFDRPWMHDKEKAEAYHHVYAPVSEQAKKWEGWAYKLKPAVEPIVMARKPLDGTIAENVLEWGVGGINIDDCRIPTDDNLNGGAYSKNGGRKNLPGDQRSNLATGMFAEGKTVGREFVQPEGRFPSNLLVDDSEEVQGMFSIQKTSDGPKSTARFYFCAKASKHDRQGSTHSTVKPTELMQYLVKLITPEGGTVIDCFAGTGGTGVGAVLENRKAILIEMNEEYCNDIKRKLENIALIKDDAEPVEEDLFRFE